jgi:hypothetical protein
MQGGCLNLTPIFGNHIINNKNGTIARVAKAI